MKLSIVAKISLGVSVFIMLTFFAVQTALVIGYFEVNYRFTLFGWLCVVSFMPPFFYVVIEFVRRVRYKFQSIDDILGAINESNALVELDLDGTILSCNDIFCKISGYSQEELQGKHHRTLMPSTMDVRKYKESWDKLRRGKVVFGEFRRIAKDGSEFWIYGNYNPIKNPYGETYRVLKVASDITEKKLIEMEVGKKNSYLEHAAKILRHDMHSGINTYIPRGLSSLKRRLSDKQIKDLKITAPLKMISEGLIHTQKVYSGVKEFTNLVKKDAQLDKAHNNLKDIISTYLSSTSYYKQVVIEDLGSAVVNEALFCTAVDNLIRNGLKYNDSPTKKVSLFREGNSLYIQDNGRGMSQEQFLELSQPYTRGKDKEQGTGLGLNICIAIMEEHSFTVKAEKLEQGTNIIIELK